MQTASEYQTYVDSLPKASHTMEHITNFGKIVARGFILLAGTIERSHAELVAAIQSGPVDPEQARARRAAQRKAQKQVLREQLADLEAEDEAEDMEAHGF